MFLGSPAQNIRVGTGAEARTEYRQPFMFWVPPYSIHSGVGSGGWGFLIHLVKEDLYENYWQLTWTEKLDDLKSIKQTPISQMFLSAHCIDITRILKSTTAPKLSELATKTYSLPWKRKKKFEVVILEEPKWMH